MYHKISVMEKFLGCAGGGGGRSVALGGSFASVHQNCFVSLYQKHRRVTLLFFTKFLVSETLMDKMGRRERVSRFLVKNFRPIAPKFFLGEPLSVSLNLVRKILCSRRLCHDFLSSFFSSGATEKLRRGTLLCFTKILVSKNFVN